SNDDGRSKRAVELPGTPGLVGEADARPEGLAERIGGRARQHRNGEHAGAHDPESEHKKASGLASGRTASAARAEVAISVSPWACSVAAGEPRWTLEAPGLRPPRRRVSHGSIQPPS